MLVYIAGPYSAKSPREVDRNIEHARRMAVRCWAECHAVVCPHLNTYHFEREPDLVGVDFVKGDLRILARCDALVLLPAWMDSEGAKKELAVAEAIGLDVFFDEVPPIA